MHGILIGVKFICSIFSIISIMQSCNHSVRRPPSAFGVVEMLVTVAILATLATVAVLAVSNVNQNTQQKKLESDVQALNSAIRIYLANGGSLDGVTTANGALNKLKSSRSKADKKLHAGAPSGSMIDKRVSTAPVDANSWKARANYNAGIQRFEVVQNQAGIEFILDESLGNANFGIESRDSPVNYAKNSSWVWDHAATVNPAHGSGPNVFSTNPNPTDSTPPVPEPEPAPEPEPGPEPAPEPAPEPEPEPEPTPDPPRLPTPVFDKSYGPHPEDDFPLPVAITNLPSVADGIPMYQLNSDAWQPYTGPVSVPMNASLRAQFLTADPTRYRDSYQKYIYVYPVPDSLTGTVESDFHSVTGGPNLVYEITNQNDYLTHGDPVYLLDGEPIDSGSPNSLEFVAQNFANVEPNELFTIGVMNYHNGNSYYDSHATGAKLNVRIHLPEYGAPFDFDLSLDLVNTENDPDDSAASADYVRITNLNQNIGLQINGVSYRLQLEFGATDSFGFSTTNQFHVYEGATGSGELLGKFIPN